MSKEPSTSPFPYKQCRGVINQIRIMSKRAKIDQYLCPQPVTDEVLFTEATYYFIP